MENKIKFSVIIPVYNAEKYLKKCLKSVLNQTYDNYEIIAVNDGSTDKSGEILQQFSKKHSVIKYIFQENKGEFCARKTGIMAATGDYITFIDPDDWYSPDLLNVVCCEIQKNDADIIQFCNYKIRYGIKKSKKRSADMFHINNSIILDFINGYGEISYVIWNKAFRSDIIKEAIKDYSIRLRLGADAYTNLLILTSGKASNVSIIPNVLYNYRQGSGVSSAKDRINAYQETMKFKKALCDLSAQKVNDKDILKSIYVDICSITKYYSYVITENCTHTERKEIIEKYVFSNPTVQETKEYFSEHKTNIEICKTLSDFDLEQYCNYIEEYAEEFKNNLTPYQKIQRILHI